MQNQDTTKAESETTVETSSTPTLETSDRSPRTSDVDKWDKNDEQHLDEEGPTRIFSGKYFEINPGQYFENNPGQYSEDNPGQYQEQNPGQYYDPHLTHGQYHEVNPGQYRGDHLNVQVNPKPDKMASADQTKKSSLLRPIRTIFGPETRDLISATKVVIGFEN